MRPAHTMRFPLKWMHDNQQESSWIKCIAQKKNVDSQKLKHFPNLAQKKVTGLRSPLDTSFCRSMSLFANLICQEVMTMRCQRVKLVFYIAWFPFTQLCSISSIQNTANTRSLLQIQNSSGSQNAQMLQPSNFNLLKTGIISMKQGFTNSIESHFLL